MQVAVLISAPALSGSISSTLWYSTAGSVTVSQVAVDPTQVVMGRGFVGVAIEVQFKRLDSVLRSRQNAIDTRPR